MGPDFGPHEGRIEVEQQILNLEAGLGNQTLADGIKLVASGGRSKDGQRRRACLRRRDHARASRIPSIVGHGSLSAAVQFLEFVLSIGITHATYGKPKIALKLLYGSCKNVVVNLFNRSCDVAQIAQPRFLSRDFLYRIKVADLDG